MKLNCEFFNCKSWIYNTQVSACAGEFRPGDGAVKVVESYHWKAEKEDVSQRISVLQLRLAPFSASSNRAIWTESTESASRHRTPGWGTQPTRPSLPLSSGSVLSAGARSLPSCPPWNWSICQGRRWLGSWRSGRNPPLHLVRTWKSPKQTPHPSSVRAPSRSSLESFDSWVSSLEASPFTFDYWRRYKDVFNDNWIMTQRAIHPLGSTVWWWISQVRDVPYHIDGLKWHGPTLFFPNIFPSQNEANNG